MRAWTVSSRKPGTARTRIWRSVAWKAWLPRSKRSTPTLQRLGIEGSLYRTLRSTNTIENLNGGVATYTRNVKRWKGGGMIVRWVSAAVLEAQKRFRRIRGYKEMNRLIVALERVEQEQETATDQQVA